ncbi:ferredoxin-type protein NapG [Sulfobacillus thermosulfidooxidans DSM 9293]|uniref:Ferredoxin-type protein NapG n=1 Tax=Sulfobacillus thermosulfidooxidans (strain DSM 9293 / VKM B-1269 / AT-1) TaxID=929705 RepID=A0A1W1WC63_SULTA|nr:4Fe-4S dicluster domain-containing protein [Sulfobacillus thermosulfidooxidans]SMC03333.1 ferredoxin-type protein NapG [Sulfobacillus thermosulfidooxidans DSM 9293]
MLLIRLLLQRPKRIRRNDAVSRREFFQEIFVLPRPTQHVQPEILDPEDHPVVPVPRFRPPGAVAENAFIQQCVGCGLCADACPVGAIVPDDQGLAMMDVNRQPCLACRDVPCSRVCPHGALKPLEQAWEIAIGHAVLHADSCWQLTQSQDCGGACLNACPLPHNALKLYPGQAPDISELICLGCGQCVNACPSPGTLSMQPR